MIEQCRRASLTANIVGVFILPDGTLVIGGTPNGDTVTVRQPAIPIGYWNLNDPAGSTVVLDSSPTGNNGTFFAGPQGTLGVPGVPASLAPYGAKTAASFAASPLNYLAISDNAAYHLASGTIEFWFITNSITAPQTLFAKTASGDPNGLAISLDASGDLIASLGQNTITTRPLIAPQAAWYNLAFTFGSGFRPRHLLCERIEARRAFSRVR